MATANKNTEHGAKTILEITRMTCASCSARIEKNLAKLPGVLHANVNLATEKATVEYDQATVDEGKMVELVKDLGYGVREEQPERVDFAVTGMTCASCSARIERTLRKLPGIESANVNLATERATVLFRPSLTGMADFRRDIEDAGYGVREEEASATGRETRDA